MTWVTGGVRNCHGLHKSTPYTSIRRRRAFTTSAPGENDLPVAWIRKPTGATYLIGDQSFDKCGTSKLHDLAPTFQLGCAEDGRLPNFHRQNDILFPFQCSSSELFKVIQWTFSIETVTTITDRMNNNTTTQTNTRTATNASIASTNNKLELIEFLFTPVGGKGDVVRDLDLKKEIDLNDLDPDLDLSSRTLSTSTTIPNTTTTTTTLDELNTFIHEAKNTQEQLDKITNEYLQANTLSKTIQTLRQLPDPSGVPFPLSANGGEIPVLLGSLARLRDDVARMQIVQRRVEVQVPSRGLDVGSFTFSGIESMRHNVAYARGLQSRLQASVPRQQDTTGFPSIETLRELQASLRAAEALSRGIGECGAALSELTGKRAEAKAALAAMKIRPPLGAGLHEGSHQPVCVGREGLQRNEAKNSLPVGMTVPNGRERPHLEM